MYLNICFINLFNLLDFWKKCRKTVFISVYSRKRANENGKDLVGGSREAFPLNYYFFSNNEARAQKR